MPLDRSDNRVVAASHGKQAVLPDPAFERLFADDLRTRYSREELLSLYRRFSRKDDEIDRLLRRVCFCALARRCGAQLHLGVQVSLRHPETFSLGDGVFIAEGVMIHGRYDGECRIGNKTWIGPQSYLDARNLVIGDFVGWGPGAKVLGSKHTGTPADVPIIVTDLEIAPVRVHDWADIGTNAVLMPGTTVGRGAIVGAGAVVAEDVPPMAKVAGVPARVIGWRVDNPDDRSAPGALAATSNSGDVR